jgi:hypothetical protein
MLKIIPIAIVLILITAGITIFRPVPIVTENEALSISGTVEKLFAGSTNDIVIKLRDNKTRYYINRGTERGLNIDSLKNKILNKPVVLKYPDYWTPLDPNNKVIHISKVETESEVLFNEFIQE